MRKIDYKQRHSGGSTNGYIQNSFRSISSCLRIVSSGASTVASTVRSAASAASSIVDRDTDVVPDQVLWAGFDKLECEGDVTRQLLLLGFHYGFQVWDVEDANNVRKIVSRYDGAVFFMQIMPKTVVSTHSGVDYVENHPLLVICADGSFSAGENAHGGPATIRNTHGQVNGGSLPTVVWFYSLKSQTYIKELKFRSVVYSVRCSSRIVAVLQAAQVHCFDAATLQREYTIVTNPIVTCSSRFDNIGLGPLAVGPRWVAYSGSVVPLPNTRVTPQHLTNPGSNGSVVAHYAKQSSKQLAVGIVTLGDIAYKKLSRYYSEFAPDGTVTQQVNNPIRKDLETHNGHLPDTENIGMVIVRDVVTKSVIAQFKAHDSPIASLCFDPSGTLLVTASVHGHNFNVFRITPGLDNGASYVHLYRLQRGFTNAVIQDISFSVDSRWITISSSRGTNHLFAISPSGGPVNIISDEESLTNNQGCNYDYNPANKPPITLSAISRIRSGNSGWKNVVTGPAVAAASGRMNTYSGVIASTFHKCKGNNTGTDLGSRNSKYHMLVFSSSGSVVQYALRVSSEVDTVYDSPPHHEIRLTVEPIQKWNICNKQNKRDREDNVDIYGENGHTVNRKVFPERIENVNIDYFDGTSKVKRDNASLEESNHVYISEVELHTHQSHISLWARAQINFQSLTLDDVTKDECEIEIEKIPTHTVEAKSRYLVPTIDHFQHPRVQTISSYEHKKLTNGSSYEYEKFTNGGFEIGDEDIRDDVNKMPVEEDINGFVNNKSSSICEIQPETVNNRENSVSDTDTQSEHVNNNIGQKLNSHCEDKGDEFN
ncbi:autophagy-related protein 18f-like [Rutidosis leptorrhynchoides]|uniref:autophagy-related protein 18f-like n=1 Tax=Rutidosis leptorrhynchoides TaxID=125765 RepID=UPI003A993C44